VEDNWLPGDLGDPEEMLYTQGAEHSSVWGEIKHPTLYKITGVCLKPLMPQI
jgi:hypothetical protein